MLGTSCDSVDAVLSYLRTLSHNREKTAYRQQGNGIHDASRISEILDDPDDMVWLDPVMAITGSDGETAMEIKTTSNVHLEKQEPSSVPVFRVSLPETLRWG
jgi:hypothetical protein